MIYSLVLYLSQATTVLSSDARLGPSMELDVSCRSLPSFLKEISDKTKVPLRASTVLGNLKVDVYVNNQPIGRTLDKLSEALNCEWKKDGEGYVFVQDALQSNREKNFLIEEEKLALKNLEKKIAVNRLIGQLVPPSDDPRIPKELTEFLGSSEGTTFNGVVSGAGMKNDAFKNFVPQYEKAKLAYENGINQKLSATEMFNLDVRYQAFKRIVSDDPDLQLARLISLMSPSEVGQFKEGTPFAASTVPGSKFKLSPGDTMGTTYSFNQGQLLPQNVLGLARVIPGTYELSYVEYAFSNYLHGLVRQAPRPYPFMKVPEELKSTPFYKDLMTWNQVSDFAKLMPQKYDATKAEAWVSPYSVKGFRLGEHLRWFHKATGIPIVAQADRFISKRNLLVDQKESVGKYLTELLTRQSGYARKSGDFVLVRNGLYWRKRLLDIPESKLEPLETIVAKRKLNLTEYAFLAVNIDEIQASLLDASTDCLLVRFPSMMFDEGLVPLRIYGSLTQQQQQQCLTEIGIPCGTMGGDLQDKFRFGVFQALLRGESVNRAFLFKVVNTGLDPRALSQMSFRLRPEQNVSVSKSAYTDASEVELVPEFSSKGQQLSVFQFLDEAKPVVSFNIIGM